MIQRSYKQWMSVLLCLSFLFGSGYALSIPKQVQAQAHFATFGLPSIFTASQFVSVPAESKTYGVKEAFFDGIANMIASAVISRIIKSTTNWVNSGFQGKPAFVQDLKKTMGDLEGEVVSKVLNEIETEIGADVDLDGLFCGPFDQEIRDALRIKLAIKTAKPPFVQYSKCTIDSILEKGGNTLEDFQGDFTKGGWPAWLELTEPQNNRFGAWSIVQKEIWAREDEAKDNKAKEVAYGNGFLSQFKPGECLPPGPPYKADYEWPVNANTGYPDCPPEYKKEPDQWVTPGQVISTQVNSVLGLGTDKLKLADEFDELVSALLTQVIEKGLQTAGGLAGASQAQPGETSFADQLGEEADRLDEGADQRKEEQEAAEEAYQARIEAERKRAEEIAAEAKEYETCLADLEKLKEGNTILVPRDDGTYEEVYSNPAAIARQQEKCDKIKEELDKLTDETAGGEEAGTYCPLGFRTDATANQNPKGEKVTVTHNGFTSKRESPNLRINLPKTAGKSYDHITVDLDVTLPQNPWNSECAASFGGRCYHAIFWSLRGNERWCWDQMADVVLVGPSNQLLKLTSKVGGDQKDDAKSNFSGKYHVHYEYNGNAIGGGVARVTLSKGEGGGTSAFFKTVPFINFKNGAFFEFGQETNPAGPEAAPLGWKYDNIEIVLENDEI